MIIDLKALYITIAVVIFMLILCIMVVKKLLSIRSNFTTVLFFFEEIIGAVTLGYIVSLSYKAMENYELFVEKYGKIGDLFTFISICFCISQVIILILIWIYKFIKRHTRMIKKKRIIK